MTVAYALLILVLLAGIELTRRAWAKAGKGDPQSAAQSAVLASLGAGLFTSLIVSSGLALLQNRLTEAGKESVWRANVETASKIAGFSPGKHSVRGLDFSGKELPSAQLQGVDLHGLGFRGTQLLGARLRNANLSRADLIAANLSSAELPGARLDGAHLQGTDFSNAGVEGAKSMRGSIVNKNTCWPTGFLKLRLARQLKPEKPGQQDARGKESPRCGNGA
jgi:hypothetical protein